MALLGSDYREWANRETACAVMIETRAAVDCAEGILAVPGVDIGFIGPADLGLSLGVTPFESDEHEEALQKVLQAGENTGKAVGMPLQSPEACLERAEQGFQFLTCGSELGSVLGDATARWQAVSEAT